MTERPQRKSRVLEYFEQQKAEQEAEGGGDEQPFQDLDTAFGLDGFGEGGDK